jgi:uncharacterized protein YndB with AHSA1/START domain
LTTDPLVVAFDLRAPVAHAFEVWTSRCALWWPSSHTLSGDPAAIVFEPSVGGRIFERAGDGTEHAWGEVTAWEPPARIVYRWHLFFDPAEATEVEVTFEARGDVTTVRLEQRGWQRLGAAGPPRRAKTLGVWGTITAAFADTAQQPEGPAAT